MLLLQNLCKNGERNRATPFQDIHSTLKSQTRPMEKLLEKHVQSDTGLTLKGGRVLGPDGHFTDADLHMDAGHISATAATTAQVVEVSDCLILPGIVDAHGDGHEHHL